MLFFREAFANQESRVEWIMKLEVFDPRMCWSSGVCGATVDKKLVEFSAAPARSRALATAKRRRHDKSL